MTGTAAVRGISWRSLQPRYRLAAPQGEAVDTSTSHIGFRCVLRPHAGIT
jgi:formylglycine-generating enzyme required for sulfatase activity